MSQKYGLAGSQVCEGSHYGWAETCVTLVAKTVSQVVLESVLNNAALNAKFLNQIQPIARIYAEHKTTHVRTQILGLSQFSIKQDMRALKGNMECSILDAATNNARTVAYLDMLSPKNTYYLIIEAGYNVDGTDYYTTVFKGIKDSCTEYYGRASNSIRIVCYDLIDNLSRVTGEYPAYSGSAKTFIATLLNAAGFQSYDLRFTDFTFVAQDFLYDNALDLINGIIKKFGTLFYYVEGDGTFVMRETSSSITVDYDYASNQNIFVSDYMNSVGERCNYLRVNGQNIYVLRENVGDQATYGIRKRDLQSNLIQNQTDAESAADAFMLDTFRQTIHFTVPFNPYIVIDSVLNVNVTSASLVDQVCRVTALSHSFQAEGKTFKTTVTADVVQAAATPFTTTTVLP